MGGAENEADASGEEKRLYHGGPVGWRRKGDGSVKIKCTFGLFIVWEERTTMSTACKTMEELLENAGGWTDGAAYRVVFDIY